MGNYNEGKFDTGPFPEPNPQTTSSKMTNHINLLGFNHPEKLAEGPCPHCHNLIALWATTEGLELSLPNHIVEAGSETNNTWQEGSIAQRHFSLKPNKNASTISHQSLTNDNTIFNKRPFAWLKAKFSNNA